MSSSPTDLPGVSPAAPVGTDAEAVASYLFEMGVMKHARRTGWWIAGVRDPESIAEHSFRTAVLATAFRTLPRTDTSASTTLTPERTRS
jgi:putative hydrolases of HD superfamily